MMGWLLFQASLLGILFWSPPTHIDVMAPSSSLENVALIDAQIFALFHDA